ncbi:membrane-anchored mycosin MYCP [Prauserella alba]|uniref:S8 family serine peptidase n=1 Tax=Prauserella alba TaxID=176898 RepID=A0ABN1VE09_9PSEU|nr:membrane-anchored mycosin MYCP [Prauserella alba]
MLLTAAIGATTAFVPALPAAAQAEDWSPPADTGLPPVGSLRLDGPNETYERHTECVQAAELEEAERLRQAPWGQLYLRLDEAHRILAAEGKQPGAGETVTVIDTGVEDGHPYLAGPDGNSRVNGVGEYVKVDDGPGVVDCDGHGTEVAGIIGANTPPDIGFQGVAPHVQINAIRQSSQYYEKSEEPQNPGGGQNGGDGGGNGGDGGDGGGGQDGGGDPGAGDGGGDSGGDGGGQNGGAGGDGGGDAGTGESSATGTSQRQADSDEGAGTLATLAAAIIKAADEAPGSVMNVSINNCQSYSPNIDVENRKLQAAVKYAHEEKNVVVVTAAGNVGENCQQNTDSDNLNSVVSPPVFADHVLSVAAVGEEGTAPFSMNGPWVGVAAPGTKIISLDPAEGSDRIVNQTIDPSGNAAPIEGTSFAAPYVAGLAVLVRQMYPNLDATQVMHRIKYTAHHPATPDGHDQYIGEGVIDPVAALTADVPKEMGIQPIQQQPLPDDLPPANVPNWTPFAVAVTGSAGALVALGVTMFVVHTVRRKQKTAGPSAKTSSSGSPG